MQTDVKCVSCVYNSFMRFFDDFGASRENQWDEVRKFSRIVEDYDYSLAPPYIGDHLWSRLLSISGEADPLSKIKHADNERCLGIEDKLSAIIDTASDPLATAVRLAIGGNLMDSIAGPGLSQLSTLINASEAELAIDEVDELRKRLTSARSILYLTDNAGEIVCDKIFIRYLLESGTVEDGVLTVGVRGRPIINDALLYDAQQVGLDKLVKVIDNGNDGWGTMLERSSEEFKRAWDEADLVISKGMGNFETLDWCHDKPICFLLMAKCEPVAHEIGSPVGGFVCRMREAR